MVRTPSTLSIPSPPSRDPEHMLSYLQQLDLHLRQIINNIHTDIAHGNSTFVIYRDSEPEVEELDEGEFCLYDNGTNIELRTRVNNSMYTTTLEEVT